MDQSMWICGKCGGEDWQCECSLIPDLIVSLKNTIQTIGKIKSKGQFFEEKRIETISDIKRAIGKLKWLENQQ